MLIKTAILQAIERGEVTLAFRRWRKPTVVAGSTLHTAIGLLKIESVDEITEKEITVEDARHAGFPTRTALLADLRKDPQARIYRIRLRHIGADPRIALRENDSLTVDEMAMLRQRLEKLGPWTYRILQAVADRPELAAVHLAAALGVEKEWLKPNVRKLKNLGLTESLHPGYRLSPRGRALLSAIKTDVRPIT